MKVQLADIKDKIEVSDSVFDQALNEPLIHQTVVAINAGKRSGTKAQKTRSEVRGGGAKPWKQKGTGRARAGTNTSPIWVGGGCTFAAKPRDHSQKINKKMYQAAMRSILSELIRQDRLVLVEDVVIEQPKTKLLLEKLNTLGFKKALFVVGDWNTNLYLSARNLPGVDVRQAGTIDPVSLLKFDKIVMTVGAVRKIEEVLA